MRSALPPLGIFLLLLFSAPGRAGAQPQISGPAPMPVLPASNWWNADVSRAPVDSRNAQWLSFINNGGNRRLHPDWGAPPYGIPFCTVPGNQPLVPVVFDYADESDPGAPGRPPGYPIPNEAKTQAGWIEGYVAGGGDSGDRHMLLVDREHQLLYELFALTWNARLARWEAGSGAVWPLDRAHYRRTDTWTSADAAGLAILPGLVRYDEAYGAEPIRHAFRFTTRATNNYYVFPASHRAGSNTSAPPLGTRLRMKASVNLSGYAPPVRKVFEAMKTYGLILADNGSDMFITGVMDPRWDMDLFVPAFHGLHANDFEVIQLGWQPRAATAGWAVWE